MYHEPEMHGKRDAANPAYPESSARYAPETVSTRMNEVVQFIWSARHAFRLRGPLADDPTARVLHVLLIGSSIWMLFNIAVILPFVVVRKTLSLPIDVMLPVTFFAAWVLLQRGFMQQASLVYVGGMGVIVIVMTILSGGIQSRAIMPFYVALPISAAWLLGFRAALLTAAAGLGSSLAFVLLDLAGLRLPTYFPGKPLGVWSNILYATVIATVPAAQVLRNLKEALAASQRNLTERTRIAQELHDTLIQEMVAVGLQLDIIDGQIDAEQNAFKPALDVVRSRVRETISHGRRALSDLRSSTAISNASNHERNAVRAVLDTARDRMTHTISRGGRAFLAPGSPPVATNDLIESLSKTGAELSAGKLPQFHILVHGTYCQLDSLISYELDRIGREAIINAFRHARAKSIEVGLFYSDDALRLVIRDDGCGMPSDLISEGCPEHFGLQGMRERAERSGGRLIIWSRPGRGTELSVTVPLRVPGENESAFARVASWRPFGRWIGPSLPHRTADNHTGTKNRL